MTQPQTEMVEKLLRCPFCGDEAACSPCDDSVAAEEQIIVDFQCALEGALRKSKLKRKDLAERLGVSEARVSQMFADDANITLRGMARVFDAVGKSVELKVKRPSAALSKFTNTKGNDRG